MFYQDTVVTIVDGHRKPIRELEAEKLNNGRKCKVILPFDTEYQFLIKNNCDTRIKLDIDIDGTNVTNDGLVVFQYQNFYLERFLNSPEKFKFVRRTHEKVSDPSNYENGTIKVKVYKEIKPYIPPQPLVCPSDYMQLYRDGQVSKGLTTDWMHENCCYDSGPTLGCNNSVGGSMDYCKSLPEPTSRRVGFGPNIRSFAPTTKSVGEAGATVGGSRSNQQFTTTEWNGDHGVEAEFIFTLRGLDDGRSKKLQEYYKLKEELGI